MGSCVIEQMESMLGDVKVSVIMTAHNTEAYAGHALHSVLKSEHEDLDVIVIDDGSTDATAEVIENAARGDARVTFVQTRKPIGRRAALEVAHEMATGEVQCWVDSDDLIFPNSISEMLPHFSDANELLWSRKNRVTRDGTIELDPRSLVPYSPTKLLVENMISHLRMFTTDLFHRSGGVGKYEGAIDWDMNLRMTEHTVPYHVPLVLYQQQDRPGRMSGSWEQFVSGFAAVEDAIERRGSNLRLEVDIRSFWKVVPG